MRHRLRRPPAALDNTDPAHTVPVDAGAGTWLPHAGGRGADAIGAILRPWTASATGGDAPRGSAVGCQDLMHWSSVVPVGDPSASWAEPSPSPFRKREREWIHPRALRLDLHNYRQNEWLGSGPLPNQLPYYLPDFVHQEAVLGFAVPSALQGSLDERLGLVQ